MCFVLVLAIPLENLSWSLPPLHMVDYYEAVQYPLPVNETYEVAELSVVMM